jgi:glycosyltransferase involved in cell wall biosynthesis
VITPDLPLERKTFEVLVRDTRLRELFSEESSDDMQSLPGMSHLPILADATDTWYAFHFPDMCDLFEPLVLKNFPSWVIWFTRRFALVRGWLFFLTARKYSFVLTTTVTKAAKAYLFFESVLGRPRKHLIFIEFIQQATPNSRSIFKCLVYHVWLNWILKRLLKKSLLIAHVLTEIERSQNSELFEIPKERFIFIPWPKRLRNDRWVEGPNGASAQLNVVSSGREACDWQTIFKAAEGQAWHLTIICSREDLPKVRHLNSNGRANVLFEISMEDHEREIKKADVYVLSLLERERSSGHCRIMDVTRAGIPVVATAVKGIEGYIDNGETGLLVPPGDALLLRKSVNRLLADASYRRALAKNAFDRAASHTREDYMEKIKRLVRDAVREVKDDSWNGG